MNFYPNIYMAGSRSSYQGGGQAPEGGNPQMEIYQMLQQRGILGDMSFEQFSQMPPQEVRQLMQQVQQSQQPQEQPQQNMQPEMGQEIPMASMGTRIPLPIDQNQVEHLTMANHTFSDEMAYGGRGYMQYGERIEPLDSGAEEAYMSGEPELEPIYGEDPAERPNTSGNAGNTATQIGGAVTGMGAGILKGIKNNKKTASSAENVAGDVGGGMLEGATAGAAFGPLGMLAGAAAGGVMGGIDNANAYAAEQEMLRDANKANNVGGLGSSLAAYGIRTRKKYMRPDKIALGERLEVERMRNMNGPTSKLMKSNGVVFLEEPRVEEYGTVVVFQDLYGTKWDLLQLNSRAS